MAAHLKMMAAAGLMVCAAAGARQVVRPIAVAAGGSPLRRFEETADRYFREHPTQRMYLQLDKPLYQPGETIHARAFGLRTLDLGRPANATYTFTLHDPKGAVVANRSGDSDGWELPLDASAPGGQYSLTVTSSEGATETRAVTVSQYETPRFKKKLDLDRKAYGPGDELKASAEVRTATNTPFARRELSAVLTVDGSEQRATVVTDERGKATVRFTLPPAIERGDAQLSLFIKDAGVTESVSTRVPVVLRRLRLSFYPEGGDLIRGLPMRIYFTARDPLGKPVDVEGDVVDDRDNVAAHFRSIHDGLGRFAFHPAQGRIYHVEVTRPSGIDEPFQLPRAAEAGCVLSSADDFKGAGDSLAVEVGCSTSRTVLVSVYVRENRLATVTRKLTAGHMERVELELPRVAGVARVTLFSDRLEPLAERLLYRHLDEKLTISVHPDRPHYSPRDPVTLEIRTADLSGRPVRADLALAVVDDTVNSLAADKSGHLRTHLLLERELADAVDDPDYYLSSHKDAPAALDALLGTRGWRRFAWQQIFYQAMAYQPPPGVRYKRSAMPGRAMAAPVPAAAPEMNFDIPAAPAAARAMGGMAAKASVAEEAPADAYVEGNRMKVREIAAPVQAPDTETTRSDFRQTVYWNASIRTGRDGHARVSFNLPDTVTSFRATAEGFSPRGLLGTGDAVISATLPFYVDVKVPLEVSQGDRIDLPVTLRNGQSGPLSLLLQGHFGDGLALVKDPMNGAVALGAQEGRSVTYALEAASPGKAELAFTASAGEFRDKMVRTLDIAAPGFPHTDSFSGTLTQSETRTVHLKGALKGSLSGRLTLYPSPVATMVKGLESMVREPVGCFEQASSANYPNVMVATYAKQHGEGEAILQKTAPLLQRGYQKVTSYETPTRGYEWFGGSPGHEALSAYGLLEFADMRKVFEGVDTGMVGRTAQWLLGRRDGHGGFQRNARALDTFGRAGQEVTNGYIVYALCEAGYCATVRPELEAARLAALQSHDPYQLALAVKAHWALEPNGAAARELVDRLVAQQRPDGSFHGAQSITASGGKSLDVETTSLAALALLAAGRSGEARSAVTWLTAARDGYGGFGSTQATVLALKALTAYDAAASVTPSRGEVSVRVNGVEVQRAEFEAGRKEPVVLDRLGPALHPGDNEITISLTSAKPLPYSLAVDYSSVDPASSPDAAVRLSTSLSQGSVPMGGTVRLEATLDNVTAQGQPMTLARLGLPGGTTFQLWQLKELVDTHQIDFFETRAREVIVYYRALPPKAHKHLALDLVGAIPGQYTSPASSAYLYYTAEKKAWASPLALAVTGG